MPGSIAARWLTTIFICASLFSSTGCRRTENPPALKTKPVEPDEEPAVAAPGKAPTPPLEIAEPPPSSRFLGDVELETLDEHQLLKRASTFAKAGRFAEAAQFQYWAVKKSGEHQYNLACYLAQSGQTDAAFYWLQAAAMEEGVDPEWASKDNDLHILHTDSRWKKLVPYFEQCAAYWAGKSQLITVVIVPKSYNGQTPLTTVVGLHGNGDKPRSIIFPGMQRIADELNVAFVGVSGTIPHGKSSFLWSVRPEDNHRHIVKALESVADRLQVKEGGVIAMGVAQGGQTGLEAAARHPDYYAGAIVFSPSSGKMSQLDNARQSTELARRGFVIVAGANEVQGIKTLADRDQSWAREAGARVIYRLTPDQSESGLPIDFAERLAEWIRFVSEAGGK